MCFELKIFFKNLKMHPKGGSKSNISHDFILTIVRKRIVCMVFSITTLK